MAQNTNTTPIQFKCPKGKSYIPENNIEQYQFQLKHSLLAHNIEKNPGKYCYINDTKFGEVSGCSNETQKLNYTTTNIIQKISNDSFSKRNFIYDHNYVSQPPHYNMENTLTTCQLSELKHIDERDLYK
tara:strand:- start:42 stop:428 length:387 start_codon:yes stop_codon:yes gene_type:complete